MISGEFSGDHKRTASRFRSDWTSRTKSSASLALLESQMQEVSLTVSIFLSHRRSNEHRLTEETSRKIRALVKTRPFQTDIELRACLSFWDSLEKVYGDRAIGSRDLTIALLDAWQTWINCSPLLSEQLLDATLWWLEEFDQSDIGWRPPRTREVDFFAAERIREAARHFFKMHQGKFPEVTTVSGIRPARERRRDVVTPHKSRSRITTTQPLHIPCHEAYVVSSSGLHGNMVDGWRFPK